MSEQFETTEITSDDKLWAALGYPIALIAIIVLFMEDKKTRPFIKYHAIQSIALNIILFALMLILTITFIGACLVPVLWLVTLWPAYDSYQGNYTEIPLVTNFLKKQNWI